MTIVVFEFRLLLRNRLCALTLLAVMFCSTCAIYQGHRQIVQIEQEREHVSAMLAAQHQQRANAIPAVGSEAGDLAYYSFHAAGDTTHSWSFIALGNRVFEPAVQRIRMLGLQAQLYDGQVQNPEISAAGSFDFAFVAVFLLPLLCVVLGHNARSSERESGRSDLLETTTGSVASLIRLRLLVRAMCAFLVVFLPLLAFVLFQTLPMLPLLWIGLCMLGYIGFWMVLFDRLAPASASSAENAMRGLMLWLVLVLVIPQAGQMFINLSLPTTLGNQIALAHRQSVAKAWDIPKQASFEVFFREHPEWQNTAPVLVRFHWKWYYAFHHVADMQQAEKVRAYEQNVLARQRAADYLGFISPSIALQGVLERFADSRIERVLARRQEVTLFHTELRRYFYPFVFQERLMRKADFLSAPRFQSAKFAKPAGEMRSDSLLVWILGFWVVFLILFTRRHGS